MADLSVFNLSKQRPQIFEAFQEGRQRRQERNINQQIMQENEIKLENLETGQLQEQDEARLNAIVNSALILQGTPETRRLDVLGNRIEALTEAGIPTDDLEEVAQLIEAGDTQAANEMIDQAANLQSKIGGRKVQRSQFTEIQDEATGNTVPAQSIVYTDGTSEVIPLTAPAGFEMPEAETAQEERSAKFADYVQRQEVETREAADRAFNNAIASGEATDVASAKRNIIPASNNLRKARDLKVLLGQFETGGFSQSLQNSIQSFFGVRPDTEEEADNLMKAQAMVLMANFTGAISEGERAFVVEMAPNFGLSTAGNHRILDNLIEDAEVQIAAGNAAMRGRDAYDTYLNELVSNANVRVTEKDILDEYGEDRIAAVMAERGMTREAVIEQAIKDKQAEAAQ